MITLRGQALANDYNPSRRDEEGRKKKSPTGNFPLGVFSCSVVRPPPPAAVGWLVIIGSYQFPPFPFFFNTQEERGVIHVIIRM